MLGGSGSGWSRLLGSDCDTDTGSVRELGEIFAQLDPLREVLEQCLDGWEPPKLVVVGHENTGKSTLLEAFCQMPLFPHKEEICTRLKIEVRLRRGQAIMPRLEVVDARTGRTVRPSIEVPLVTANVDVREAMEELVIEHNNGLEGVDITRVIRVHVQHPDVPNLDVIDLPGVVTSPPETAQLTRELVSNYIAENKDRSVFMGIVDAPAAPNTSSAMQILGSEGVLDKTIGVITMCDFAAAPQQKKKVLKRLAQASGSDAVPLTQHGYVATMNAPVDQPGASNLEKLRLQKRAEPAFFKGFLGNDYQREIAAGRATTGALGARINDIFLRHIVNDWVPSTLGKLALESSKVQAANAGLGIPAAHGLLRPQEFFDDRGDFMSGNKVNSRQISKAFEENSIETEPAELAKAIAFFNTHELSLSQLNRFVEELQVLQNAAQDSLKEQLQQETPWLLQKISSEVLQPLRADVKRLQRLQQVTSHAVPLEEVDTILESAKSKLRAMTQKVADDQRLQGWLYQALCRPAPVVNGSRVQAGADCTQSLLVGATVNARRSSYSKSSPATVVEVYDGGAKYKLQWKVNSGGSEVVSKVVSADQIEQTDLQWVTPGVNGTAVSNPDSGGFVAVSWLADASESGNSGAVAQARTGIMISNHPCKGCDGLYQRTGDLLDGVPHYTNGLKHLYYRRDAKVWYLNNAFTPDDDRFTGTNVAYIEAPDTVVPIGDHVWFCDARFWVGEEWQPKTVTTAVVDSGLIHVDRLEPVDTFKLGRFPQLVGSMVEFAAEAQARCKVRFLEAADTCIDQHLSINGPSVSIEHNLAAMTANVSIDTQKLAGALIHLYAVPQINIIKAELPGCVVSVTKQGIRIDTEDDCNPERLKLLDQARQLNAATVGIENIACRSGPSIVVTSGEIKPEFCGIYRPVAMHLGQPAYQNEHGSQLYRSQPYSYTSSSMFGRWIFNIAGARRYTADYASIETKDLTDGANPAQVTKNFLRHNSSRVRGRNHIMLTFASTNGDITRALANAAPA